MLHMISNIAEVEEALELIHRSHREIVQEGIDAELPLIGVMVEVPSAVYQARALARRVDFLSVGSNDLTQYLLAVDRNNARVADLYHSLHPAVLQALVDVAAACKAEGKKVGICGELAGDPEGAVLLLAMGYDLLSMNATSLPKVKQALRNIRFSEAEELLAKVLQLDHAEMIHRCMQQFLTEHGMERFIHNPMG
jgi:phosphotransferase system enzyme I (PtsP)